MAFQRGDKKPPNSGRKKGTPNTATAEAKAFLTSILTDPAYREQFRERMVKGAAGPMEVRAWEYVIGKPRETIDLPPMGPLVQVITRRSS